MTTEVMVDTDIFTGGFLCDTEEKKRNGVASKSSSNPFTILSVPSDE